MAFKPNVWNQLKNLTKGEFIGALERDGWQEEVTGGGSERLQVQVNGAIVAGKENLMRAVSLLSIVTIVLLVVSAVVAQQAKAPPPNARVHGILLNAGGSPEDGTEVLLVEVEVLDLRGKSVPTLPSKGTSIVGLMGNDSGAPVVKGKNRTTAGGQFEFTASPGRYGVAVFRDGQKNVALLQSQPNGRPVVFDLAANKETELGSVSRKKE